jgi:xylulokinase
MTLGYVVASDLGSGGCKTVVVDAQGRVIAAAQREYPTSYPHPGWAEQDPDDWYQAFAETVRTVLRQAEVLPNQVAGVGLVGVTHNAVLLDEREKPVNPSIIIFDTRSMIEVREINERWGDEVLLRTTNEASTVWTWPQLSWIRKNLPDAWCATRHILFQKDYVRNRLAPSLLTDTIDAGGTLLYDPQKAQWIEPFCKDLGLSPDQLPKVVQPRQVVGHVGPTGAADTGLAVGTPVICGTTDTVAEMLGSVAIRAGMGVVKLASVGRIAVVSDGPQIRPHVLNYQHVLPDLWYPGTASKYAASAYRWLRDLIWPDLAEQAYPLMDEAAAQAPAGSDGLIFHPHLNGEWAPYWDDSMRADFIGLTIRHTRGHLTRAVLEGVAFALRDAFEELESLGLAARDIRLIGQGSKSALWVQIMADVLNRSLAIPEQLDAVYGAALVTAIGVNLIPNNATTLESIIRFRRTVLPNPETADRYSALFDIYRSTDRALSSATARLNEFEHQQARREEVSL